MLKSLVHIGHISTVLLMIIFMGCSPKEIIPPEKYESRIISIGNGGGFTGAFTEFYLLDNNDLLMKNGLSDTYTRLARIDKNMCQQFFKNYELLNLQEVTYNEPGNMYQFIAFQDTRGKHEIKWAPGDENPVIQKAQLLYTLLSKTVSDNKNDDVKK